MTIAQVSFWILSGLVAYVYVGYPLLLVIVRAARGRRAVAAGDHEPPATLIISAYNEESVIEGKLRASLALDYPRENLEIVVVSDASTDRTDEIVQSFAAEGVKLLRMPQRGGKTLGLNAAVAQATGEIIVFSDANAIYDTQAVRLLARTFADPEVGAAVGESRYAPAANAADKNESAYWKYECALKRLESDVGSVVGGDGAIFAIRKSCYEPMAADALSDFVTPLQIVRQGYRCVYVPEAYSVEEGAGRFDKEWKRKVRIVNRAWRATMGLKGMLNPFAYGLFAVQLLSHKLLRWLMPGFLIGLLVASSVVAPLGGIYALALVLQLAFYALAVIGFLRRRELPFYLSVPYYFCLVNVASLTGIIESYLGKSYTTWTTARAE